jgi:hypothetical protein
MALVHIALIAAVCLADGILLLWKGNGRAHRWVSGNWFESLAKRIGSTMSGNRRASSGAMCRATGSVRP